MTWEMDTNSFMTGRNVSLWTALMWVFRRTMLKALKPKTGTHSSWCRRPGEDFVHTFSGLQ